jgi:hypothetical protein
MTGSKQGEELALQRQQGVLERWGQKVALETPRPEHVKREQLRPHTPGALRACRHWDGLKRLLDPMNHQNFLSGQGLSLRRKNRIK